MGLFVLFAGLIIAAEQNSPLNPVKVEGWDADYLATVQEGNVKREIAYVLLAAGTAAVWLVVRRKSELLINRRGSVTLGLFLAWAAASTLWSEEPAVLTRRLLILCIVLFWVYVCSTRWSALTVVCFVVFSSFADISVSIATEMLNGRFAPLDPDYRLSGTLAPNELALDALVLVVASLTVAGMSRRWRSLMVLCATSGLLTILLTKSRTALVALAVSVTVLAHKTIKDNVKLRVAWLLVGAGLLAVPIITGRGILDALSMAIPRTQEKVGSLSGRLPLWQDIYQHYVLERPVLGFGYSTFWTRDHITKVSNDQGWGVSAAHSAYLEVLLALGLPGLILYIAFVSLSLRAIQRRQIGGNNRHLIFCCSLIWALLIVGVTESELAFRSSSIYFYSLIAYLLPFVEGGMQERSLEGGVYQSIDELPLYRAPCKSIAMQKVRKRSFSALPERDIYER